MAIKIFFSYAHEDEELLNKLKHHLSPMLQEGLIDTWREDDISEEEVWKGDFYTQLNEANIILLLVSQYFMDSDYCYSIEMNRAMERHKSGEAWVIPVIVRPVYWQDTPFGKLQALPRDGKPIKNWRNLDDAYFDVAEGIRKAVQALPSIKIEELKPEQSSSQISQPTTSILPATSPQLVEDNTSQHIYKSAVHPNLDDETSHFFTRDKKVRTESGTLCEVEHYIGTGGQGEVYEVKVANRSMALKWYFRHSATQEQKQALKTLVKKGPPSDRFLWPLELVTMPGVTEFGYLMPLRDRRYKSLVDLMMRHASTTFGGLARIGLQLAESYYQLHAAGMYYRDISFGNVFFDPSSDELLLCDNDAVVANGDTLHSVLGTSRFMAPEIVRGEALPSVETDLYSLSVLLFYLFMFHHPLEGRREYNIHILDSAARTKIYGSQPLFIFDPFDHSNEPVLGYQDNAIIFWSIYPQFLRDLFTQAFTDGLSYPVNGRVKEIEWRAAMASLLDSICYCPHCDMQNFYDADALTKKNYQPHFCWNCKKSVQSPMRLQIEDNIIMLNHDTRLYPHHIDNLRKFDYSHPVAHVIRHPSDPNCWELKNSSDTEWIIIKADGSLQKVGLEQNATLIEGLKIYFGHTIGEILPSILLPQHTYISNYLNKLDTLPLHFIWITDCSGSMTGDKIQTMSKAIRETISEMQDASKLNPQAQILVRLIKFSSGSAWHIAQPTPIDNLHWRNLTAGGVTDLGSALMMVADELRVPPMEEYAFPPVLVLITDGYPTDDASRGIKAIMDQPWGKKSIRLAIGIGEDVDYASLNKFIANPVIKVQKAHNAVELIEAIKLVSKVAIQASLASEIQHSTSPISSLNFALSSIFDNQTAINDVW